MYLIIRNCNVNGLQENCYENEFRHIIIEIDLSFNKIEIVRKGTFKKLQVFQITLKSNIIKAIENEAFFNLPNLTMIDLSNNQLQKLNPHASVDVPVLDVLHFQCK